jgi:hypothetical protein
MSKSTTTKLIPVDALHFADNPRTDACMRIPEIVDSFRLHGFNDDRPLVASEKTIDGETVYHVLCGNRRGSGLHVLRDNHPEDYARVLSAHPGKVPAIVHRNLTAEMETELRIDHTPDFDRVPLDAWSEYLAIQQLVQVGTYTEEKIALKLGLVSTSARTGERKPRRSYVQARTALAKLPDFVQTEIRKLCEEGKDSTPMRWANVLPLYKVYNEEYIDHPNGDGPGFEKAWASVMVPAEEKADNRSAKELSPAEAVKRSQAASSDALKKAFLVVTRQSDEDIRQIDASIKEGETAKELLQRIADYLGPDGYNELIGAANAAADTAYEEQPVSAE